MLDILDLLPVPGRFLQSLDDQGSCGGDHGAGGLPVLDLQLDSHFQTLPVSSSLGNVVTIFLGDKPSGPTLGAREEVAPTSPPTALRYTYLTSLGSNLGPILLRVVWLKCTKLRYVLDPLVSE